MKSTTTIIFISTLDNFAKAYFFGRFSCRNLAKANVLMVSKKMIPAIQFMYSGCLSKLAHCAIFPLKIKSKAVNKIVDHINETERVLYNFFWSSSCEKRKYAVSNPYVNNTFKKGMMAYTWVRSAVLEG